MVNVADALVGDGLNVGEGVEEVFFGHGGCPTKSVKGFRGEDVKGLEDAVVFHGLAMGLVESEELGLEHDLGHLLGQVLEAVLGLAITEAFLASHIAAHGGNCGVTVMEKTLVDVGETEVPLGVVSFPALVFDRSSNGMNPGKLAGVVADPIFLVVRGIQRRGSASSKHPLVVMGVVDRAALNLPGGPPEGGVTLWAPHLITPGGLGDARATSGARTGRGPDEVPLLDIHRQTLVGCLSSFLPSQWEGNVALDTCGTITRRTVPGAGVDVPGAVFASTGAQVVNRCSPLFLLFIFADADRGRLLGSAFEGLEGSIPFAFEAVERDGGLLELSLEIHKFLLQLGLFLLQETDTASGLDDGHRPGDE